MQNVDIITVGVSSDQCYDDIIDTLLERGHTDGHYALTHWSRDGASAILHICGNSKMALDDITGLTNEH